MTFSSFELSAQVFLRYSSVSNWHSAWLIFLCFVLAFYHPHPAGSVSSPAAAAGTSADIRLTACTEAGYDFSDALPTAIRTLLDPIPVFY
jgi:hypothetical protein